MLLLQNNKVKGEVYGEGNANIKSTDAWRILHDVGR